MKGEALIALSLVFAGLSAYLQGSSGELSLALLLAAFVALFSGASIINRSKPSKRSESALVLGVLLPLLLFLNYGNPLYLAAGGLMVVAFFWNSEKSVLLLVPAGLIMGWLAIGESSYVARFVGAFLPAVSIIVGSASLYFWLRYR
ncbi:hypothetical protein [Thermococcus thioreducens]|uniref:Uncharacterized protein n=1 Tax=Thermococcus thioreducens TaxID=277988 RepID=A0A0Q2XNW1_9EURY|nr:hypothetical protein [Thermococcus thioreducens]ASJ12225.1 hypothetical protein A3L14_04685 [Thermococcus thioreducens]KQH82964.1 hypothetical protein AMR53_01680 [Thermococcus thioreducens]SEV94587.1 hypothetical protein SAMN05216170_1030 [Thermococcus thioreducens]